METKSITFPLPSEVEPVAGTEDAQFYPYFTKVGKGDDERFWFYNGMHFPEPMPAFDTITAEAPYISLGAYNTRVFAVPTVLGIDHRIINGRVYISAVPVFDPAEIERRLALFQERAGYYFSNWDRLYAQWSEKVNTLLADIAAIEVPQLPEFEDAAVVTDGTGIAQNFYLIERFHTCVESMLKMWQYHFEFLVLGYGAYLTFFEFCKKAFPEISVQTMARMVAGVDTLMMRPDDELKKLAHLAVENGVDSAFVSGRSANDILADLKGRNGKAHAWLDAFEKAREPWFNISTGDGFYHHHRNWNDDLSLPFSALVDYVADVKRGKSLSRPTERLKEERLRISAEYRALLPSDDERAVFDQMLGLCHLVFPYVEDHKFYCENWIATAFFNKTREFGALLARHGFFADAEDVFQLHHTEVSIALSDLALSWASGSPPRGPEHWPPIVAERKRVLAAYAEWTPPPALGPMPADISDPLLLMLWGITAEQLTSWSQPPGDSNELRGFGASAGVVEGIAHVVRSVDEISSIKDGEILVCPVTAPSWAPVFGKIKAAVSDIGGAMSHAAIVAREYGLPAVVGTGHATKRIVTGQRLRVDGTSGIVTILSETPSS
jgi:pyruvate,water dikinase